MNTTTTTTQKLNDKYDFLVQNYDNWDSDDFISNTEAAKHYLHGWSHGRWYDNTYGDDRIFKADVKEGKYPDKSSYKFGDAIGVDWKQVAAHAKALSDAGFKLKRIPTFISITTLRENMKRYYDLYRATDKDNNEWFIPITEAASAFLYLVYPDSDFGQPIKLENFEEVEKLEGELDVEGFDLCYFHTLDDADKDWKTIKSQPMDEELSEEEVMKSACPNSV